MPGARGAWRSLESHGNTLFIFHWSLVVGPIDGLNSRARLRRARDDPTNGCDREVSPPALSVTFLRPTPVSGLRLVLLCLFFGPAFGEFLQDQHAANRGGEP